VASVDKHRSGILAAILNCSRSSPLTASFACDHIAMAFKVVACNSVRRTQAVNHNQRDVIGKRGENIVELCLTDYQNFARPLFRLTHLGDKWPAVDYYVELTTVPKQRPFFLLQAKSTAAKNPDKNLRISSTRKDVEHLLQIPAPTYMLGVHEPSKRVFVRSVHEGMTVKAITTIPVAYELTSNNLKILHDEVSRFWRKGRHKPKDSFFL
jgi:hypothetical protein